MQFDAVRPASLSSRHGPTFLMVAAIAILVSYGHSAGAQQIISPVANTPGTNRAEARDRLAQNATNLTLKVLIDTNENRDFMKDDPSFTYYIYGGHDEGGLLKVGLASKEIVDVWKGNAKIEERSFNVDGYIEDSSQFAPVFLVADVRNEGIRAKQISEAYLDVIESSTDFQPYLEIGDWGRIQCGDGTYLPSFDITNYGWGAVRNARMVYSFGGASNRSSDFSVDLGSFDQTTTATVEDGLHKSGLNIDKVKRGNFKCSSISQVPTCFSKLKQTGILGNLANYVEVEDGGVYTDVVGRFNYEWISSDGKINSRVSPFAIVLPILHFEVGGPECGAPGPVERNLKPIHLSLDKKTTEFH